jgi:diguanylate cyclase (GGDEF)-like protein
MEKLDLLSSVDLFSQLGPTDLSVLAEHAAFYEFAHGETIFTAGTTDRELFMIDSGSVRVSRLNSEGREVDLARFVAPESFGEQDFLSDNPRNASAYAEQRARLLIFPRRDETLEQVMKEHPAIFAHILHQFLVMIAGRIRSTNKLVSENSGWVQELRQQVFGDKLTGLYSRTFLDDEFGAILSRSSGQTGFLMVKPDNFKLINDTHGHEVGDKALRLFANHIKTLIRENDIAIRYRGNEFAVIVPSLSEDEIIEHAGSIQRGMKEVDLSPVTGGASVPLTFSVGVAVYPSHGASHDEIVARAHELVFVSRDRGGDQVLCANCAAEEL